jgi:molybdopterin molybdotransferase
VLTVAEAREKVVAAMRLIAAEDVAVVQAFGRVLAEDLAARRTQPPQAVSAMDGYAVRAADIGDLPATLTLVGQAPAGGFYDGALGPGEAVRIFTGGPVPDGADTVVIQEDTESDGKTVTIKDIEPSRHIRAAGLDFNTGDTLLTAGRVLSARDAGLIAAMDRPWVKVRRKPRVAILSTGDEIVMPGDPVGPHQIVSANSIGLSAAVSAFGGEPVLLGIAPDDRAALADMAAGAKGMDLLVTTGGASVGDHDLIQEVLGDIGLDLGFWRIAMRPGKPLIFGDFAGTPMLGLPGNPVSTMVCALIFLKAAIHAQLGLPTPWPETEPCILGGALKQNGSREDYMRATLETKNGCETVVPFPVQDSSMMVPLTRSDCFVVRAPGDPAHEPGESVAILRMPRAMESF